MLKKLILGLAVAVFVLSSQLAFAQKLSSPSSSPTPEAINSYEVFWPLVAGKTMDDPLYFLKSLKENLREILIFGNAEKANYQILIATKRILEAEVLINKDKFELALTTLDRALKKLHEASSNFEKAKQAGSAGNYSDSVIRLENVRKLIGTILARETDDSLKNKLNEVNSQAESLHKKITQ